jgi:NAD(P)-dependent dehydrogenase (short-subunit alcohol dehydrogenase family)
LARLIHCAAVFVRERRVSPEGFELMFATNHLGPFLLTRGLLSALRAGALSRVVTVSAPSTTELDFSDLQSSRKFSAFNAFGATKTANLLFAYELARRLDGTGVTSNVFFPGVVRSKLMRDAPAVVRGLAGLAGKRPEEVGTALAWFALDPSLDGVTGRFFKLTKESDSSEYSRDPANQRRLWEESEQLTLPWVPGAGATPS